MKQFIFALVLLFVFTGCAHRHGGGIKSSPMPTVSPDPNFVFGPIPTTQCDGTPEAPGVGINVFGVAGPGPMATVSVIGNAQAACNGNKIDTTKATKLNSAPITVITGTILSVPVPGQWTFCEETQDASGNRSLIGDCLTKNVSGDPLKPAGMTIGGLDIRIIVAEKMKPPTGLKVS